MRPYRITSVHLWAFNVAEVSRQLTDFHPGKHLPGSGDKCLIYINLSGSIGSLVKKNRDKPANKRGGRGKERGEEEDRGREIKKAKRKNGGGERGRIKEEEEERKRDRGREGERRRGRQEKRGREEEERGGGRREKGEG